MELFQAADQFGVERLKRMCESTMLASINVDNAASIFHAADERNAKVSRNPYAYQVCWHEYNVHVFSCHDPWGDMNILLVGVTMLFFQFVLFARGNSMLKRDIFFIRLFFCPLSSDL